MKRVALLALLATGAVAAQAQSFVDRARVQNVEPQYESVHEALGLCGHGAGGEKGEKGDTFH